MCLSRFFLHLDNFWTNSPVAVTPRSMVNDKIMQQMINVTYLLLSQQSSHPHWSIELILDDPQIPSVLDLRLDDLRDDFFPLGSALGARQTNGSLWIEDPITENLNREI